MPKGYRGVIATIGLIVLCAHEARAQSPQSTPVAGGSPTIEEQNSGGAESDHGNTGPLIPLFTLNDPNEADATRNREERAEEREQRDLTAQELMAEAAADLVRLTGWQLWLGLLGTVLIGITVAYTVRTYRLTLRTSRIELRPYISIIVRDLRVRTLGRGTPKTLRFRAEITNKGTSPALNVLILEVNAVGYRGGLRFFGPSECTEDNTQKGKASFAYFQEIAGSGGVEYASYHANSPLGGVVGTDVTYIISIKVHYRDAIGTDSHRETFWFESTKGGSAGEAKRIPYDYYGDKRK